jgi:hypothetical protein
MRKKKIFYINDGVDGVIIAKNLKHAVSILRRNGYGCFPKQDIIKSAKTGKEILGVPFNIESFPTKEKRSRMVGWCE